MRSSPLLALLLAVLLVPLHAAAGGFYLFEVGSPAMGRASAGYAARAADAETVFTNPAGMTRLDRTELMVGVQGVYGDIGFTPGAATTVAGNSGGNAVGWLPGASAFFATELAPNLKVGVAALQYFGSALDYDPGWVGRYYGQKGVLLGFSLAPSAAYRVNEWLSVGAGLNAMLGLLRSDVAINNASLGAADGRLHLEDEAWGFGANVGVLLEPSTATRVGVTWLSAVKLGFEAPPTFTGLGSGLQAALGAAGLLDSRIGLGMTLPNRLMVGVHHDLSTAWAVMADVGWESWSQFGKLEVSVDAANPTSLTRTVAYQDTWHAALGAEFRPSQPWLVSAGVAYDSSMVTDDVRTVLTPIGAQWRFGAGAEWAASRTVSLGIDDSFIWGGTLPMAQDRGPLAGHVEGEYRSAFVNFVALNLRWRP